MDEKEGRRTGAGEICAGRSARGMDEEEGRRTGGEDPRGGDPRGGDLRGGGMKRKGGEPAAILRRIYGRKPGRGDAGQSSGRGDQSPKVTASSQGEATSPYGAAERYCEPPPGALCGPIEREKWLYSEIIFWGFATF